MCGGGARTVGRDPATLETSTLTTVLIDENAKPDQIPAEMTQRMVVGSPDSVADQIKTKVLDAGIDGVIINLPFYTPGVISAAGEALRPLVGCSRACQRGLTAFR